MGTHPVPSVLPKSGAEGRRTSIPTSAATRPVAAAVTRQLDTASPRPVTNPGTMGRRCNPHLTCHMPQRWRLCLTQPAPTVLPIQGLWGGLHRFRKHRSTPSQMLQALQHSFSAAASSEALLRCRTVAVMELQLLPCSLTQSAPVSWHVCHIHISTKQKTHKCWCPGPSGFR